IQDLRSTLFDLKTTVKSHDVIIQQLEDRMNEFASQVAAQIKETSTSSLQATMDNAMFEWEIEEEVIGETIADFFLKGEELEEVNQVHKDIRNYSFQPRKLDLDLKNRTTPLSQPSIVASPKLELKPVPLTCNMHILGRMRHSRSSFQQNSLLPK
ncbi:hypothetical protein HAX54_025834, partial [Datura stramonium]|nr:hypothetical protein [Datura stramonium]